MATIFLRSLKSYKATVKTIWGKMLLCAVALLPHGLPPLDVIGAYDVTEQFPYGRPEGLKVVSFTREQKAAAVFTPIDWATRFNPLGRPASTNATSQGRCATCAFFAGIAAAEGAWAIGDTANIEAGILPGTGHPLVKLSEQELIDCKTNAGYALYAVQGGVARAVDAPLANHSDPTIKGCRGITNCTRSAALAFAFINGTRGPKSHDDVDILPLLALGPMAVSINANAYGDYRGGILNCSATGSFHVDHANALVGYGEEPPPPKCATQPANRSFTTFCDTAFVNGAGGRENFAMQPPAGKVTLEECCAWCAAINPPTPAWNAPVCRCRHMVSRRPVQRLRDGSHRPPSAGNGAADAGRDHVRALPRGARPRARCHGARAILEGQELLGRGLRRAGLRALPLGKQLPPRRGAALSER